MCGNGVREGVIERRRKRERNKKKKGREKGIGGRQVGQLVR